MTGGRKIIAVTTMVMMMMMMMMIIIIIIIFVVFLSNSKQTPGHYLDKATTVTPKSISSCTNGSTVDVVQA
jgi:sensor histidine kinase regulating citrate/malate metabolism